ncbi:SDR family oxidoreductase [Nocardia sp. NPDC049526]|uniref:SDR family oxidoreductase n=1 Tax=Nocardia sp. NPDC049526 TaxID=3364316 RepID=UPI0037A1AD8F
MTSLDGAVLLITGANGGIGREFVSQALSRGASKVYATARVPRAWDDERIVPLQLDVNDPESVSAAVEAAADLTMLINNAGILHTSPSLLETPVGQLREVMETNFFGPVLLSQAFAPVLTAHAESALVNVHSVASWYALGGIYSASKAALWSATNSLRLELDERGVQVVGVHVGFVDTPMAAAANASGEIMAPQDLVRKVFDAVEADEYEVIADEFSANVKAGLSAPIEACTPNSRAAQSRKQSSGRGQLDAPPRKPTALASEHHH